MRLLFTFASEHNAEVRCRVPMHEGWDVPDGEILIHVLDEFHSGTRDTGVGYEFNANNSRVC